MAISVKGQPTESKGDTQTKVTSTAIFQAFFEHRFDIADFTDEVPVQCFF